MTLQHTLRSLCAVVLCACSQTPQYTYPLPTAVDYPDWIVRGSGSFVEEGTPLIIGVGMVSGVKNPPLAKATASNRARSEIAQVLEVYSASLMKDYSASTNGSEEQHVEQAIKTFSSASLEAVTIPQVWRAPDGTTFARAQLDYALLAQLAAQSDLTDEVKAHVRENAQHAFSELDRMEACHQTPSTPPRPAVDVLFVVDNSGSMHEEQFNLGRNFESFFSTFSNSGIDFQVAVVTTDVDRPEAGRFRTKVIKPDTEDLQAVFIEAVHVGTTGSNYERGLESVRLALSDPNQTGTNAGFLRDGARLAVIVLSDENDQSPLPVSQYTQFISGLKGGLKKSTFVAMVGQTGGCSSANGMAQAGTRYMEMANAFGDYGIVQSICQDDFASALSQISGEIEKVTSQCR